MIRLLTLFALLLLAACTGSTEPPNPVLLVVGYGGEGDSVALVRSDFGSSQGRLTFLPASVRPLAAPTVSYDVVDREGARSSLAVLSRGGLEPGGAGIGSTGTLTTFSLTRIDPDSPTNFAETGEVTINDFTPVPRTLQGRTLEFCPKDLQVTQRGDYAAVLNDPSLCGLRLPPFIDLLDLRGERLLARLTGVGGVSAGGLYLAQGASADLLYYATREAGSLQLQRATLPRPGQTFPTDEEVTIPTVALAETIRLPGGENDARDLQRAGTLTEERLVFLFRDSLQSVTDFSGEAEVQERVETASDNAFVVRDDRRELGSTFVLSTPNANTLAVFPPPSGAASVSPEATAARAVAATFEPNQDIMYFVGVSRGAQPRPQVSLLPLASFSPGDDLPDLRPADVPQLTDPRFVTWAQAVPGAGAARLPVVRPR